MTFVFYYLVALIVLGVTHLVYKWRNPKCNGVLPPGSMGLPFIGETLQYFSPQPLEGIPPFISQRIARYGPLFRTSILGERVVVSSDPVVNQHIFQQEGEAFQCWYTESSIKILGKNNVNGQHGNAHKYLRNLFLDLIGPENLKGELIHEMDGNTRDHLSSWACKDEVDVKEELEIMVFKLAAKKLLDFDEKQVLEMRENYKFLKKAFISLPLGIPGTALHAALQGRKKAKKMIKCAFDARRLSKENNLDFIGRLLKEIEDEGTILTEEIAADLVYVLLFAAFETTSTTITLCLKFIHEHPKVLEQLKEEHQQILNDRVDKDCPVTWKEYKSMNYTHMVINETVRLADNAPGIFRKVMEDVNIKGYTVPTGWTLVICPSVTHYNPDEYDNPYLFNPSRWQGQELHLGSRKFMAFGGGRRLCAGADFAKLQMAIFIHYLVTKYRWKITKEGSISRTPGITFNKPICVQVTKA
ncbi:hypothetical protein ACJIZ3_010962 [Penstemon smallii]|uniref:Cytochrome P450 n=1 Tax=Penstemon smallii TaxID=265156 RepID=A0ABD3UI70_9LAMI